MKIKILGQTQVEPVLHIDGTSGNLYKFRWDSPEGAYTYTPHNQEEADDIFQNQHIDGLWFFSAVMSSGDAVRPAPEPLIPRQYYADLEEGELRDLCADCGLKVVDSDQPKTMIRLLEAFYTGQNVEVPKTEAPEEPEAPATSPDAEAESPDTAGQRQEASKPADPEPADPAPSQPKSTSKKKRTAKKAARKQTTTPSASREEPQSENAGELPGFDE